MAERIPVKLIIYIVGAFLLISTCFFLVDIDSLTVLSSFRPQRTERQFTKVNKGVARVTNATLSSYEIIPRNKSFVVGDKIRVVITARDEKGRSRQIGGDFFRAKIVSNEVKASSRTDGEIVDLGNGTYHADFTLRWPGRVQVYVMLVLGGHAAFIMDRMQAEFPSRARYLAKFKKGEVLEVTGCDIDHVANKSNECDFTDKGSVVPWFCEKPRHPNLTCEDWYWHNSDNKLISKLQLTYLRPEEQVFFQDYKRFLICKDCYVDVKERNFSQLSGESSVETTPVRALNTDHGRFPWQRPWSSLPPCEPAGIQKYESVSSGYFYRNSWFSNQCRNRRFNFTTASDCVKNKTILIVGDSTSHQIYKYMAAFLKHQELSSHRCRYHGTRQDIKFNLYFKFHGLPTRGTSGGPSKCSNWNAVEVLDELEVVPDVLVLGLHHHFSVISLDLFRERLRKVRAAVKRLLERNPRLLLVLRSANTRSFKSLPSILSDNEWYIYQLDRILSEMFADFPRVCRVDLWSMTVTQFDKENIHAKSTVISNAVDMIFSYICPV